MFTRRQQKIITNGSAVYTTNNLEQAQYASKFGISVEYHNPNILPPVFLRLKNGDCIYTKRNSTFINLVKKKYPNIPDSEINRVLREAYELGQQSKEVLEIFSKISEQLPKTQKVR